MAYVYAETVGRAPAEAMVDVQPTGSRRARISPADEPRRSAPARGAHLPLERGRRSPGRCPPGPALWNGEGEMEDHPRRVPRPRHRLRRGLLGIYFLLVYQTRSYAMPLILMISIPLTMIGIMPGFWLLNSLTGGVVGGFPNPVFFTATAMIGMIALSGIAVRNAILLIEFVHVALAEGVPLRDAPAPGGRGARRGRSCSPRGRRCSRRCRSPSIPSSPVWPGR